MIEIMGRKRVMEAQGHITDIKPSWSNYMSLGFDLWRVLNLLFSLSQKDTNIVILNQEEEVEVYEDDANGNPKVKEIRYRPFIMGKMTDKFIGNYVNGMGRMTIVKGIGKVDRVLDFSPHPLIRTKAQGLLSANPVVTPPDIGKVITMLGSKGVFLLLFGANGVGKSYSTLLTCPKPALVLFTEPTRADIVYGSVLDTLDKKGI